VDLRKSCCHIRKVEPLNRALEGKQAWITGQRRAQAATRTELAEQEDDTARGMQKFNPLADWTEQDVWTICASMKSLTMLCMTVVTRPLAANPAPVRYSPAKIVPGAGGGKIRNRKNADSISWMANWSVSNKRVNTLFTLSEHILNYEYCR
jgi:hypothetical protein